MIFSLFIGLMSCNGKTVTQAEKATVANNAKTANTTRQPLLAKAKQQPAQVNQQPQPVKANVQRAQAGQTRTMNPPAEINQGDYKAKNEGWLVNMEEAFDQSKKSGKPIMANFTGSDWCGWCKRLDKSVFHQPGFKSWAEKNVVLLELDFPRRFRLPQEIAAQNRSLQQTFGVRGYPTIWLFDVDKDANGKYNIQGLGKTGYTKTLDEFKQTMGGYMANRKVG